MLFRSSNPSIYRNPGREKELNIAYRFWIYPTKEQKILLGKTFGCCRFLYNQMLNDKIQEYKKTTRMLKNTPAMYKKAYPFLKEVDSLALANVQLHLEKAYKNFFRDPKVGFPRFKSKHHSKNSYTTNVLFLRCRVGHLAGEIALGQLCRLVRIAVHKCLADLQIGRASCRERV